MAEGKFKYQDYDQDMYKDDFDEDGERKQKVQVSVEIETPKKQITIPKRNYENDEVTSKLKLIDQHHKLKSQLRELGGKMDEIIEKQREKRKKRIHGNYVNEDEKVQKLKKDLQEQANIIHRNKHEISKLRKNLDNRYDIVKIVEKEDELKHLKKQLQALETEKQSLERVRKTQVKAIKFQQDKQAITKKERMERELRELTQKNKERSVTINEKQRQVRRLHEAYRIKEQRIKEIQSRIKENKLIDTDVSDYGIIKMENQIKQIEKQRQDIERDGNEKIRQLEREKKEVRHELDRKKLIKDEKQKDLKLSQLKHKQIIRLISSSQLANHSSVESRVTRISKENPQNKRTIPKQGRQAPKIEGEEEEILQTPKKQEKIIEKKDYGFSANLEEDIIEDN